MPEDQIFILIINQSDVGKELDRVFGSCSCFISSIVFVYIAIANEQTTGFSVEIRVSENYTRWPS